MTPREWWDREAVVDTRYATLRWGGDGTPETVEPTMNAILANLTAVIEDVRRNITRPMTVCEIGCGPGRLLRPLAHAMPAHHFIGLDVSHGMTSLAGPWPDNVIVYSPVNDPRDVAVVADVVYSVEVFQHLTDQQVLGWLEFATQALFRPTGRVVFQYVEGEDEGIEMCHPRSKDIVDDMLACAQLERRPSHWLSNPHDEWRWVIAS